MWRQRDAAEREVQFRENHAVDIIYSTAVVDHSLIKHLKHIHEMHLSMDSLIKTIKTAC